MYCKNCGNQIADGIRFCPECGKATGIPAAPVMNQPVTKVKPAKSKQERYKKHCPKCESEDITMETVVETRGKGCLAVFLYLLFALIAIILAFIVPPVGIILLLLIIISIFRKKNVTVTYGVCQNCGMRWRVR